MVHAQKKVTFGLVVPAVLLFSSGAIFAQQDAPAQQDPPSRVARLNYINGTVSMEPAGVDDWAPAELNRPFTIGDYLYADQGGQAELHLDVGVIRMGSQTSFGFLNLDDRTVQLKLSEGDLSVRIRHFDSSQVFEVDTPNAAVTLLRDGVYRFRVDPNGAMSFVVVREGQAEVNGGGQAFTLNAGNSATLNGTEQASYDIEVAPQPDEFDQWCQQRDAHEARLESSRYVSPAVVGYEDLDDYGAWSQSSEYGAVWYPRSVDPGWAPYRYGHWAWVDPWGWTWVDSQPWGFAPFHYGRWAYIGNRWGWCPGPVGVGYRGPVVRPYYAPAMVAWFGGAHWGVGISVGGGPSLGWVPLGWGEVYTPAYHCSPRYFNNVNVYNTRIVKTVNITNVYNTVYVKKTVYNQQYVNVRAPNAVIAMPQAAFASGRSVRQAAIAVRPAEITRIRTAAVIAPPVAPTRQAFLASAANRPAVRPPAQVAARAVVARRTPPPEPAPLAARQQFLQQHATTGQPLNIQAMHQAAAAHRVEPNVRTVAAVTPVAVKPGARGGVAATNRPAAQPRSGVSGPVEQPAAAAHGAPPNRQMATPAQERPAGVQPRPTMQPNERVNQPAQNRPDTDVQRPAPAAHGVPPNRQMATPAQERPAVQPRPTMQPNERVNQPAQNRPDTDVQRPAPAAHGVPPNRQTTMPAQERPAVQPRPTMQPNERVNQPAQERPVAVQPRPAQPAVRNPQTREGQTPQADQTQRSQPVYRQPAQPRTEPAEPSAPRSEQPAPERRAYPTQSTVPQERSQRTQQQPQGRSEPRADQPTRQERPSDHANASHDNQPKNNDKKNNDNK
ncbi:MAG TPA: DUF6600 domain-containing protein [Bryobacteraceae bacterium]